MLAGLPAEKSQDTFSFSPQFSSPSCSWGTQKLGVHKHNHEPALPGQGTQTSVINCSVFRRKDNLGHYLPQACALVSLTLSLPLFSRLKHHLCFLYRSKVGRKGEEEAVKAAIKSFLYWGSISQMLALGNFIIYLCWNGKGK